MTRSNIKIVPESESFVEDKWLYRLQDQLEKRSVHSRKKDDSLYNRINYIIQNKKSKFSSVEEAVKDMQARAGYLDYIKSENTKTASDETPEIFKLNPAIKETLDTFIMDSKGNLPSPAVLNKIRSLFDKNVKDKSMWEDEKLLRYVVKSNLSQKANYDNEINQNLGKLNIDDNYSDPSNTDAFYGLLPKKF